MKILIVIATLTMLVLAYLLTGGLGPTLLGQTTGSTGSGSSHLLWRSAATPQAGR